MEKIDRNPFTNRSTITREEDFIGRKEEISSILSRVQNGDSTSVVGPRRIGKSSLLYHLYLTGNKRLNDGDKKRFKFIYIDLLDPVFATVPSFCKRLIKKCYLKLNTTELKEEDNLGHLSLLSDFFDYFQSKNILPVILLDEFEQFTKKTDRFADDFFNSLRAFGSIHKAAFVTASQRTLKELTENEGLTSPLWNIFSCQTLGEFSDDEVKEFLTHYWTDLEPTQEEYKLLISYCSYHPLVIQVVSYCVLNSRKKHLDEWQLKEEIEKELSSYFLGKNEMITRWLKKKVPAYFKNIVWTTEQIGKVIKEISPLSLNINTGK